MRMLNPTDMLIGKPVCPSRFPSVDPFPCGSPPRQQPLVIEQYAEKLRKFGNIQEARGGALSCLSDAPGGAPRRMLTYGTLVRAVYLAHERWPDWVG